jgi:hypothetical protein
VTAETIVCAAKNAINSPARSFLKRGIILVKMGI